ncbi:aldose epimerase family protein [Agromyces silvae]|uniref:aldose epimerase family protein n=1 Tax=Agromyces silvae TaxID=3388266 RepID=UPI00280AADB2|nr:hypothetical protein [Agromyces protaetiae]
MSDPRLLEIGDEELSCLVSPTGATLHRVRHGAVEVLSAPYAVEPSRGHHGAVLAPWPNRVADAAYRFDGVQHRLPVNDHAFGHAIHGFVFDREWHVEAHGEHAVRLSTDLADEPGYPFEIHLEVAYRVEHGTLRCSATWENVGDTIAPFGIGFHPYLRLDGALETWTVHLPAGSVMDTDGSTKLPLDARPTAPEVDFVDPARIGARSFSRAYGELERDERGVATVQVASRTRRITITCSSAFRWVQLFTADLPEPGLRRAGLAVEPQTCPPNAFATGADLVRLAPRERGAGWWSLRPELAP